MKITVVMLYDEGRAILGDVTAPLFKAYAQKHGYQFVCYRQLFDYRLNPSWNKLIAVRTQLRESDWVLWVDADVLLLRDDIRIESVIQTHAWNKPLVISLDKWGVCFGIFLVKNCFWSETMLDALPLLGQIQPADLFDNHDTWEQNTIKCLMHYFSDFRSKIATIPEWLLANQNSDFWPRAWMCHYWASGKPSLPAVRDAMLGAIKEGWSTRFHKV
jgi:hypothetical protein